MKIIVINSCVHGIKECLIDDEDYNWIKNEFNVYLQKSKKSYYVNCRRKQRPAGKKLKLHRAIFSKYFALNDKEILDHIDRNPLNNQKNNLRIATFSQNCINRTKSEECTSFYKGVSRDKNGRWDSRLKQNRRYIHIGIFDNERYAAIAYDLVAQKKYGNFAVLNIPNANKEEIDLVIDLLRNAKQHVNCHSKYYGVTFDRKGNRWMSNVYLQPVKTTLYVGSFATELDAAIARDKFIDNGNWIQLGAKKSLIQRAFTNI